MFYIRFRSSNRVVTTFEIANQILWKWLAIFEIMKIGLLGRDTLWHMMDGNARSWCSDCVH